MIQIHTKRLLNLIDSHSTEIDERIDGCKKRLKRLLNKGSFTNGNQTINLTHDHISYLSNLEKHLVKIVKSPSFEQRHIFYELNETDKPFKDKVISILGYKELRSDENKAFYPKFFKELGIKTCVYCNAMLTVCTEKKGGGKVTAKFQLDHHIDKAKFPCYSISFFNLFPVCGPCNNAKKNDPIHFKLYTPDKSETKKSPFKFEIDKKSIALYRLSRDENDLKISFDDKKVGLNERLDVIGIYNTQKDLAAEIITKAEFYNKPLKESYEESFKKMYGKNGRGNLDFGRFILGNYTEEKDIHNRPMAKFSQDIARQLGLIPKID